MNVYLHELRSYKKSTITWTISLCAITVIFLLIYPSFSGNSEEIKKIFEAYPESVRKAFGISIDGITSLLGFYSYVFLYVVLCGAIQAMNYGTSVISKETRDKTADFLLTKPVSRIQIITSKILAILTSILITNIIYLIVAFIMANLMKKEAFNVKIFFMISFTLLFMQILFIAIGILTSVILPKIKSVISVSLGTVFGLFIANMCASVIGEEAIRYITPFKYFDFPYIIKNGSYEVRFIILQIVLIVIALIASYVIYVKKIQFNFY